MDMKAMASKLPAWLKKYRYPILVIVIGFILMALPSKSERKETKVKPSVTQSVKTDDVEIRLTQILSRISGVGKVDVLLTVKTGQTTVYQSDEDISTSESNSTIHKETVIITDADRNEQPLVTHILPAEYLGAVIVCQGADNVQVRLAVVEAVSKATGLGADKISVLKMN